jgi:hypothetical protein
MLLAERYGERGVMFDASGGGAAFNQQNFKFDREQCSMFVHCSVRAGPHAWVGASSVFLAIIRLARANRVWNCAVFLASPR